MHASTPSSAVPTLADFALGGKLGSGGNATVHRAVWTKSGEAVALKIIHGDVTHDPKYLARFQCADLYLDTYPYAGCSTIADVLWAGLPALTCAGETCVARAGASLLTAVGLPELIATDLDDYARRALELAQDRPRLEAIRQRLSAARTTSILFDSDRFATQIEALYIEMSRRARAGEKPSPIGL